MRKALCVFMSFVLAVGLCPGLAFADEGPAGRDFVAFDPGELTAQSDGQLEASDVELSTQAALTPAGSKNTWEHDYSRTASTSKSFLHVNGGNLERVQYTGSALVVETVSSDYKGVTAQKTIPASTYQPSNLASSSNFVWGGFFSGSGYNYVATGQSNSNQDNNLVVFRITKYTKDWTYAGAAEVRGANTTYPYSAGSCDMVEYGGTLYVRTCHTMYTSSDGLRHQANVQLMINESSMSVTDQYTSVWNQGNGGGYVSHSFNQHLAVLSGSVYGLDHGDAYPRAVTIKRLYGNYANVITFPGAIGDNYTGATTGGFESSSSTGKLLSVGSRTADGSTSSDVPRNVWIATTPGGPGSSSVRNLTSYTSSSAEWADNPFLVKVNENRFLVMWGLKSSYSTHTGKIAYQFVDGNGNALSSIMTQQGTLSDCEPVLYNGSIVWYASGGGAPSYFTINASTGAYSKVETLGSATMEVYGTEWDWHDWRTDEWVHALPYSMAYKCPSTTLTLSGTELVEGTDYTLKYSIDHAKAQGTVTAVGKGRFAGQKNSVTFDIIPANLEECSISGIVDKTYTGSKITQDVKVDYWYEVEGGFVKGKDFTLSYKNNVNVGTATVTVTGKGLLSGSVSRTFTINKASLSGAVISNVKAKSYNGSAQTQSPTVKVGGRTLKAGTDYTLSYTNNTKVGTATMKITGKGNYKGTKSTTFKINKGDVSKASVTLSAKSFTYDGKAKKPTVTVKLGGRTLKAGTDYTVAYKNNTAAGTATVTVTGKGNYQKAKSATFKIKPASVAKATVTFSPASYSYNGKARTPKTTVVVGGRTLKAGTDYTVAFKNNVNVGTATATITGKGNYTGQITKKFTITKANVSKATVVLSPSEFIFDGTAKKPKVSSVTVDGRKLVAGTDYTVGSYKNNTAVGTASLLITGKGSRYTGTKTVTYKIVPPDVSKATVKLSQTAYSYNGTARKPTAIVTLGDKTLKAGTDYTISYKNNTAVGTATAIIKGKGNYIGSKSVQFKIAKGDVSKAKVALSATSYTYDGKAKKPAVTVTLGGRTLKAGTDYTVAYKNNTAAGTATVTITGKGSYEKAKSVTFKIAKANLSKGKVTLSPASYSYNGKARTPKVTIVVGGRTLKAGTDYTVAFKNNVKVGTATATITGKGNYTGRTTVKFTISKGNVSKAKVKLSQTSYTYDGKAKKPGVTVTFDGATLKAGTDYTVAYKNNTADGTATVTVTGKGSYTGSKKATFKIAPNVRRLEGDKALDTMGKIVDAGGFAKGGTVVLATADGYWDALTAAGVAGMAKAPVLMTSPKALSPQTAAQLGKLAPKKIVVCGGTGALPESVVRTAASVSGGAEVVRCAGKTATGTAADIYKKAAKATGGKWSSTAFVCTSAGYWDALAAAPISYAKRMPIFLTENASKISAETLAAMKAGGVTQVYIVGGPSAIAPSVQGQLEDAGVKVVGRLWGRTAIETSEAVASFGIDKMKMSANWMGVATSGGYWDALAGAALCGKRGSVLVLVDGPAAHSIAGFATARAKQTSAAYVFGGPAAVSDATLGAVKTAIG